MENCTDAVVHTFAHHFNVIRISRGSVSAFVGLVLILSIILTIWCKLRLRQIKHDKKISKIFFCNRYCCNPFLWLAASSTLSSLAFAFNFLDDYICEWSAYIIQCFESFEDMMTLFFAVYFLIYALCDGKPLTDNHAAYNSADNHADELECADGHADERVDERVDEHVDERAGEHVNNKQLVSSNLCYYCHAFIVLTSVVFLLIFCFLYNMPPAISSVDGGSYGKSGPWCWIKGKIAQVVFWYMLYWLIKIGTTVLFVIAIFVFKGSCDSRKCHIHTHWKPEHIALSIMLMVSYAIHWILVLPEPIVRLFDIGDCKAQLALWYLYAFLTPFSKIPLVIVAVIFVSVRRSQTRENVEPNDQTEPLVTRYETINLTEPKGSAKDTLETA